MRTIERSLAPLSVWVTAADEPVARQGREHPAPRDAGPRPARRAAERVELAGALHPTSAVGGEPWERPRADPASSSSSTAAGTRRRSAGWTPTEDGELCVALRCALLDGNRRPLLRGRRGRGRLRSRGRARRDRGEAPGGAPGADRKLTPTEGAADGGEGRAARHRDGGGLLGVISRIEVAGVHAAGLVRKARVRTFFLTRVRATPLIRTLTLFSRTG